MEKKELLSLYVGGVKFEKYDVTSFVSVEDNSPICRTVTIRGCRLMSDKEKQPERLRN